MQELIALASRLADEAGQIAREYFRQPFEVIRKGDDSPVTIADRAIEARMREILEATRPNDTIIGEEYGTQEGSSGYCWVLDPIDGTKSFVMGRPTFGTLIALWHDNTPVLGIIDQPISNERWVGVQGQTSTFNGQPIQSRPCTDLSTAIMGSTTPAMFDTPVYEALGGDRFAWGGDCYAYGLLASGHMDMIIEASLSPYDFAALIPVIEGAGGFIRDWEGNPLTLQSEGKVIALGDEALWPSVKERLEGA